MEVRGRFQTPSLLFNNPPLFSSLFFQCLSLNLKLFDLAGLNGQWAPRTHLSHPMSFPAPVPRLQVSSFLCVGRRSKFTFSCFCGRVRNFRLEKSQHAVNRAQRVILLEFRRPQCHNGGLAGWLGFRGKQKLSSTGLYAICALLRQRIWKEAFCPCL